MKKDDADQLIRCVKECWWRVAILILIPSLLTGWLLSDRQSITQGLDWTALAAIGTFLAAAAAFLSSQVALRIAQQDWEKEKSIRYQKSLIYKNLLKAPVEVLEADIEAIEEVMEKYLKQPKNFPLNPDFRSYMNEVVQPVSISLISENIEGLHYLGEEMGGAIARIISSIHPFQLCVYTLASDQAIVTDATRTVASNVLKGIKEVKMNFRGLDWGGARTNRCH
ncbi:hypothetical protein [Alcaligenes faecalis]|uniref:hypothetical protein n=1 Tax=Alcaligenes faecalis TaxID=511 RepID=UPI0034D4F59D